jgi:hypothetical protein
MHKIYLTIIFLAGDFQMKKRIQLNTEKHNKYFLIYVFILLFYPPYCKGLFFKEDFSIFSLLFLLILMVHLLFLIKSKEKMILDFNIGAIFIGLALLYSITILYSALPYEAYNYAKRYIIYLFFFIFLYSFLKEKKEKIFIYAIIISITGVSVLNLDYAANGLIIKFLNTIIKLFSDNDTYFHSLIHGNRFSSTIGYANSFAILALTGYFLAFVLIVKEKKKNNLKQIILHGIACINLINMFLTQSRGVIIIFIIIIISLYMFTGKEVRKTVNKSIVFTLIISLIYSYTFYYILNSLIYSNYFIWLIVISLFILNILFIKLEDKIGAVLSKKSLLICICLILLGAGSFFLFSRSHSNPEVVFENKHISSEELKSLSKDELDSYYRNTGYTKKTFNYTLKPDNNYILSTECLTNGSPDKIAAFISVYYIEKLGNGKPSKKLFCTKNVNGGETKADIKFATTKKN